MPTNAVIQVPATELALGEVTALLDDCRFHVEKTAFADDSLTLHTWIGSSDREAIEEALSADRSVESFSPVREADDEWLFTLEIADRLLLVRDVVHRLDGTVREAYGRDGTWALELRFPNRSDLSTAVDLFEDHDVDVTVQSITDHVASDDPPVAVLTDRQREVLTAAVERGYYEVPREVTLEELAESVDVSHQALSECLRRAQENLAVDTLGPAGANPTDRAAH